MNPVIVPENPEVVEHDQVKPVSEMLEPLVLDQVMFTGVPQALKEPVPSP